MYQLEMIKLLPFLKKKPIAGIIISKRTPDQASGESQDNYGEQCAQDLIDAVQSQDAKAVVKALRDLIPELGNDSSEPHSYDAQNELAGDEE